jgi:hypothetical protein
LPRGRLESPEGANVDNGNGGCARKGKPRDHADVVEAWRAPEKLGFLAILPLFGDFEPFGGSSVEGDGIAVQYEVDGGVLLAMSGQKGCGQKHLR